MKYYISATLSAVYLAHPWENAPYCCQSTRLICEWKMSLLVRPISATLSPLYPSLTRFSVRSALLPVLLMPHSKTSYVPRTPSYPPTCQPLVNAFEDTTVAASMGGQYGRYKNVYVYGKLFRGRGYSSRSLIIVGQGLTEPRTGTQRKS